MRNITADYRFIYIPSRLSPRLCRKETRALRRRVFDPSELYSPVSRHTSALWLPSEAV